MAGINITDGTVLFNDPPLDAPTTAPGAVYTASGTAVGLTAPITYAWKRDDVTVATSRKYPVTLADAYSEVKAVVSGASGSPVTTATNFIAPANRAANYIIALSGAANVGQPCTFTPTGDFGHPHVRFEPVWTVDGVTVGTNLFYTFTAADQGKPWTLTVPGINLVGTHTPATISGTVGAAGTIVDIPQRRALSINISGINDATRSRPFIDWMKDARYEFIDTVTANPTKKHREAFAAGELDANGWPLSMPTGYNQLRLLWALGGSTYAQDIGPFTLTWEGQATITAGNISLTNITANSCDAAITLPQNVFLTITNIGSGATQFKNLKIIPKKWQALYDAGEQFNPDWINGPLRNKASARFMDAQRTNESNIVEFSELWPKSFASYPNNLGGIPVEVMVDLANRCGFNPWFCMPTLCSDAFVTAFVTFVKNNLATGLVPKFQYSNEIWNSKIGVQSGVTKNDYFQAQADALFGTTVDTNAYSRNIQWIGRRCAQIAQLVTSAMAGRTHLNIMDVHTVEGLGGNLVKFLTTPLVQELFPSTYVSPHTVLDAIAGTNYVGTAFTGSSRLYLDQLEAATDKNGFIRDYLFDPTKPSSIPVMKRALTGLKGIANTYGLNLILYEGGFHLVQIAYGANGITFDADTDVNGPALYAFDDTPEAQECIDAMFTVANQLSDEPYMQFSDIGLPNKFGTFFMYTDPLTPLDRGRLIESRAMTMDAVATVALPIDYSGQTHVFLLAGQSNMIGRDVYDGGAVFPAGTLQVARSGGQSGGANNALVPAQTTLDHTGAIAGQMGLAMQFTIDYVALHPGVTVALVPCAVGGTSFLSNQWGVGNSLSNDAITRTNGVISANPSFDFKGILWHQGESDVGNATYQTELDAQFAAFRSNITGATSVPIILGELVFDYYNGVADRTVINNVIIDTPNRLSKASVVSSSSPAPVLTDKGDNLHFSAAALRTLGARYADKMLEYVPAGVTPEPPTSTAPDATFGAGKITISESTSAIPATPIATFGAGKITISET